MGLKDLLVHLEDSESSRARAKLGIALARAHGAHLTGLYVAAETRIPPELAVTIQEDILARERGASEATARRINAEFARAARDAGAGVETRISHCDWMHIQDVITERVRHVDLAILGQPNPDRDSPVGRAVIEAAFMETGRPALVVPYVGAGEPFGQRVLVAWNDRCEAARAVNDAMPLLERADSVTVLCVDPHPGREGAGPEPGADIALHLARHGIAVGVHVVRSGDTGVAEVILTELAQGGYDLLVMGGYGHSRMREVVLGGVTRHMLGHMTVPVLLSH
jgi:nucleotide-binding universal stress UspA family protein